MDRAIGLEARKGIGLDKFLERNAILQADGNGDGKVIHQAAKGRAFFMHINENFAEATILKFARMEIDFVSSDRGFLDIARASVGEAFAFNRFFNHAFDDFLDNAFRACGGAFG